MVRPPRIFHDGVVYHVFARGNRREAIFHEPAHYRRFLRVLGAIWADSDFSILAYCLMPNHFHLALRAGALPLGRPMQRILSTYARALNREAGWLGHVFERRYHAIAVDEPRYLLTLVRYLHLNPVRAGLTDDPLHHPWSSHGAYLGGVGPPWLDQAPVLSAFGTTAARSRRRFARFVGHPEDPEDFAAVALPVPRRPRAGNGHDHPVQRKAIEPAPKTPDIDTLLAAAASVTGVSVTQIIHGSDRCASLGRALIASMIQRCQGVSLSDFSRRCGRSMPALSNAGRRLRESPNRASIWVAYRWEVERQLRER